MKASRFVSELDCREISDFPELFAKGQVALEVRRPVGCTEIRHRFRRAQMARLSKMLHKLQ